MVLAFAARLWPVLHGGGLFGLAGYDDGVYESAADAVVSGRLPYRDFLLLHPPGLIYLLAPFALLGRVIGDADAWAVFDAESRRMLGMAGDEFLRLWDAGAFMNLGEESPFGRRVNEMTFLLLAVSPERVDAGRGGYPRR